MSRREPLHGGLPQYLNIGKMPELARQFDIRWIGFYRLFSADVVKSCGW